MEQALTWTEYIKWKGKTIWWQIRKVGGSFWPCLGAKGKWVGWPDGRLPNPFRRYCQFPSNLKPTPKHGCDVIAVVCWFNSSGSVLGIISCHIKRQTSCWSYSSPTTIILTIEGCHITSKINWKSFRQQEEEATYMQYRCVQCYPLPK